MTGEPFEPVLSTDETEALLSAMRGSGDANGSAKEVDLGSADHRLRQSLGHADTVGRELAVEVRKVLRRLLTSSAGVREGTSDVVPFNVVSSAIGPGYAVGVLTSADGALGFLVAGASLVTQVITRRLGGAAATPNQGPDGGRSALSAVDRRIVRPFLAEVLELTNARLGRTLKLEHVRSRTTDLPAMPQFEPLVRIPLTIQLPGGVSDELSLLLTAGAVPVGPASEKATGAVVPSMGERTRLAARLAQAEVEVRAELGQTRTSIRRVLSLKVGDVIRLDNAPDQPLQLRVEGSTKMRGTPVVRHGNIAIEVTEIIKGEVRE